MQRSDAHLKSSSREFVGDIGPPAPRTASVLGRVLAAVALLSAFAVGVPVGAGAVSPNFTVTPNPVAFGDVVVGSQSQAQAVTITNTTAGPRTLLFNISAFDTTKFKIVAHSCGAPIPAGSSCTLQIAATPTAVGAINGSLELSSTPPNPPVDNTSVPLSVVGVPNQMPIGGIPLSLTEGRNYGALVWAFDPNTNAGARIRMHIPGVVTREADSNYYWADMPAYTGYNRHDATVFLAQLPPGNHDICYEALDGQLGTWHSIGCRNYTVK